MRLRYTLPALADLASILDHIADRSPQGALPYSEPNSGLTNLLLQYPCAGAPTEDPSIRRMTTMPYPYLMFYDSMKPVIAKLSFTGCIKVLATF